MKAARWYGAGDVRVEDVEPARAPKANEVRLRVDLAGICATDLHEYTHGPLFIPTKPHPRTGRCAPVTMGHEFTATVVDAGKDVKHLKPGDRIAAESSVPCFECSFCQEGRYILCRTATYLGFAWDGCFADTCTIPAAICHKVPDNLKTEDAVMIEPLASGMHAVRRGRMLVGETVAIVGGGTIGLCTLLSARAAGASRIFVIEKIASKRRLAIQLGAEEAIDPGVTDPVGRMRELTAGKGVDIAFECVGAMSTVSVATQATRVHGRTVIVGVQVEEKPFSFLDMLVNERELIGTAGYFGEFPVCMALVADGRINVKPLMSAPIALNEIVVKGFEPFASPQNENIKIIVNPR